MLSIPTLIHTFPPDFKTVYQWCLPDLYKLCSWQDKDKVLTFQCQLEAHCPRVSNYVFMFFCCNSDLRTSIKSVSEGLTF